MLVSFLVVFCCRVGVCWGSDSILNLEYLILVDRGLTFITTHSMMKPSDLVGFKPAGDCFAQAWHWGWKHIEVCQGFLKCMCKSYYFSLIRGFGLRMKPANQAINFGISRKHIEYAMWRQCPNLGNVIANKSMFAHSPSCHIDYPVTLLQHIHTLYYILRIMGKLIIHRWCQ